MVLPRGNAPRSFAYQANALLLSYRRWKGSAHREPVGRLTISPDIDRIVAVLPAIYGKLRHFQPSSHRRELSFYILRIHATFLIGPARGGRYTAALMRLTGLNLQFGL